MQSVGVVIPMYNRRDLICRCLDSVKAQTWRRLEVVVVDNNSTDDSVAVVRDWCERHQVTADTPDFRLKLLSESKPGAAAARNKGLEAITSEHILFFDSDDEMLPDLVESAMREIGDRDVVCWDVEVVGLDGKVSHKPCRHGDVIRRQFINAIFSTQRYMARTDFIRCIGGWRDECMVWNDFELGTRIALSGCRFTRLHRTLVRIYAQAESITGTSFTRRAGEWEKTLAIIEQTILTGDWKDRVKALRLLYYRRVILAAHYKREGSAELSRRLLTEALEGRHLSGIDRFWLRCLHAYTAGGGRAAYLLWR